MIQSTTIKLVVAAICITSSMALPFEENNVRAVTSSVPQVPSSTLSTETPSSGPGGPSSSLVALSTGSSALSFDSAPQITSTLPTSGTPSGTKTHHGSPDPTTTPVPHDCHGHENDSNVSGEHGGGYENRSRSPGHYSSYLSASTPSGSAEPTIQTTSVDRLIVAASSSESGLPTPTVKSGELSPQVSATYQSSGQELRPTSSQTQITSITSQQGGEPTPCPTAGGQPGSEGGHGGEGGKGDGLSELENGGHKGSEESISSFPKPTQGGYQYPQGTSSANTAPTQGAQGAASSGVPAPVQPKGRRNMFRREPSLDELD